MKTDLLTALAQRALVCDGGMGTQLLHAGLSSDVASEQWNLEQPETVEAVHRAYRKAGCEILITNTFGGSAAALARHGLANYADAINEAGAQLARRGGDGAWVLGDIGPFGDFMAPLGPYTPEDVRGMFYQQAAALKRAGVDGIAVETMADPHEAALAVAAARQLGDWPIIASFAFCKTADGSFRTMMGTSVAAALDAVIQAGANVVGANCGTGLELDDYRRLAEELLAAAGNVPVIVQPNAGTPSLTEQGTVYTASPGDLADLARTLVEMNVRIIGGCCGTTPAHLARIADAVQNA